MTNRSSSPAFRISPPGSPPKTQPITDDDLDSLLRQSATIGVLIRKKYSELKPSPDSKYFTYALLLQNGYIYVGNSDNIYLRLMEHFEQSPNSSCWVREHGPVVRVLEIIRNSSRDDELYKTLEWCDLVGYEKVRGAGYCRVEARHPPPPLATFARDSGRSFQYLSRAEIEEVVRISQQLAKQLFN